MTVNAFFVPEAVVYFVLSRSAERHHSTLEEMASEVHPLSFISQVLPDLNSMMAVTLLPFFKYLLACLRNGDDINYSYYKVTKIK